MSACLSGMKDLFPSIAIPQARSHSPSPGKEHGHGNTRLLSSRPRVPESRRIQAGWGGARPALLAICFGPLGSPPDPACLGMSDSTRSPLTQKKEQFPDHMFLFIDTSFLLAASSTLGQDRCWQPLNKAPVFAGSWSRGDSVPCPRPQSGEELRLSVPSPPPAAPQVSVP